MNFYTILVNGKALSFTDIQTKQTTVMCVRSEEEAIRLCMQLEVVFGKGTVQYQLVEINDNQQQAYSNFDKETNTLNCAVTLNNIPKGHNPGFD